MKQFIILSTFAGVNVMRLFIRPVSFKTMLNVLFVVTRILWMEAGAAVDDAKNSDHKADKNLKSSLRVNPSTLAMELSIPMMSYPGRNGDVVPVGINYSSKLWRIEPNLTWWNTTPYGAVIYHTNTTPYFAERSAAGWTSTLLPPHIVEKLEMYDELGDPISALFTADGLIELNSNSQSNLLEACTRTCTYWDGVLMFCSDWRCVPLGCSASEPSCGGPTEPPPGTPELPPIRQRYYIKRVRVQMPSGSTHEFRKDDAVHPYCVGGPNDPTVCQNTSGEDRLGTFLAVDGSGMRLERGVTFDGVLKDVLYLPDGTKYVFPRTGGATTLDGSYRPAEIYIDTNGNRSLFDAATNSTIDTLGRTITDFLPRNWYEQAQAAGTQTVSLPGFGEGGAQEYKITWGKLEDYFDPELPSSERELNYAGRHSSCNNNLYTTIAPALFVGGEPNTRICVSRDGAGNPVRFNPTVMSRLDLPNETMYTFKYNRFGEITRIDYPSGAYERFEYGYVPSMGTQPSGTYDQTNRGVKKRWVYQANGVIDQYWEYAIEFEGMDYVVKTTAPDGSFTRRSLHRSGSSSFGFEDPKSGMPKIERRYDTNGQLRSRTLTDWTTKAVTVGGVTTQRDARVNRSISVTIENGQALATLSEAEYDETGSTDPEHFSHLNAKRTKSHHFRNISLSLAQTGTFAQIASYFNSSTVAVIGETDYLYDANYKARGISSLPIESRTLNPVDNSVLAKTQTKFDNLVPNISTGYPGGYTTQTYEGITGDYDCGMTAPNKCWVDPNTSYRGKPTTSRLWDSDNDQWIETHTRYDIFGNAIAARDPIGNEVTTLFEDTVQKPYKYAYPTRVDTSAPDPTNTHGTSEGSFSTSTYDFMTGLPLTSTNEFGQTTATEYDDPLLRPTKAYGLGDFVIPITETIYDDNAMTVTVRKQIDANNWDEATTYMDSLGRTIKTRAKDSQGDVFVETKYDLLGRVQMVTNPYRSGDTILWSLTEYDEMGRAKQSREPVENQNPASPTGNILGVTSYDISTAPGFLGLSVTTTDAAGKKGRSITNALGQLVVVEEPDHQGNLNPLPQSSPEPSPTPTPGGGGNGGGQCLIPENCPPMLTAGEYPSYATFYKYNALGKMVEVTQGVQKRWFKYDSLGRLIRVRQPEQEINTSLNTTGNPDNNSWTAGFTYDVLGNVLTATDANGVTITNTYDNAGRVKTRSYSGEPQGQTTPPVSFYYDGKGLAQQQSPHNYAKGKLTRVENGVSATEYMTFDNLGRLTRSRQITDGVVYGDDANPMTYTYNLSGALVEEKYPSGRIVKNEFESDGDIARIYGKADLNATERTYANAFSYMPDGRIEKLRLGNGLWESAKFNTRLQVTEFNLGYGPGSGNLWKLQQEYGEIDGSGNLDTSKNTGNIARQTVSFDGLSQPFVTSYKYDSLYRLAEARETQNSVQTWKQNFTYDRYGNRKTHQKFLGANQITLDSTTHPTIDETSNRFDENQGYIFDKNGNLTTDPSGGGRSFVFNGDNKQREVRDSYNNLVGEYFFDGEGKRVKKHVYNGGVLSEVTVFVYSSGKLIAEYSTAPPEENPTTKWTVTDQLGSPRVLVNSLGEVVSRRDFMPFGEEITPDGTHRTTNLKYNFGDNVRQKFTGYQKDEETQLDFAEARMYQNLHGRFTAVDPLLASGKSANPQTFNRYVYVMNNPLIYTDPTGLQTATASGRVYRRGNQVQVFNGDPERGWKRVRKPFNTTTTINGVKLHLHVRPNGWRTGGRVDGATFSNTRDALPSSSGRGGLNDNAQTLIQEVGGRRGEALMRIMHFLMIPVALPAALPAGGGGGTAAVGGGIASAHSSLSPPVAAAVDFSIGLGAGVASERLINGSSEDEPQINVPNIYVPSSRYPQTTGHILDSQASGYPSILTLDRGPNSIVRRNAALGASGLPPIPNFDRDEYPPAMFLEGGEGASVRYISPSDNKGAGKFIQLQALPYPNGSQVRIVVVP